VCGLLAAIDKVYGVVQRPLPLAAGAYLSLCALLVWSTFRPPTRANARRPANRYMALVVFIALTGIFTFVWRLSADPTPVMLQKELAKGDALMAKGDKDGAYLLYREANKRYPKSHRALWSLGAVNYQLGDFERARKYFNEALELSPPNARWRSLNDLGQTYWKLGQPEEAVEYYHQAREAGLPQTELIEWHYRLAWAYFDLGDYDTAIEQYRIVAEAGQKYAAASFYNIACALAQKLRAARDGEERQFLAEEAVDYLRQAWAATEPGELEALRAGIIGPAKERDPDLTPLQGTAAFQDFTRDLAE
jgi:tetratricopeptide (TPR) repeat protein